MLIIRVIPLGFEPKTHSLEAALQKNALLSHFEDDTKII